jgi:hypothetical protein
MKNLNLNNLLVFHFVKGQIRGFSKSYIKFSPASSFPSAPVESFTQGTDQTKIFLGNQLIRDLDAIEQLDHTIEHNRNFIRDCNNDTDLTHDHSQDIATFSNAIIGDLAIRADHEQSALLLEALLSGNEPPINNMGG